MAIAQAARAIDGHLVGTDRPFRGVSTDSRTVAADQLFFALRGPRFDAHEMLDEVAAAGAAGAVVERPTPVALSRIEVADTRRALGLLARAWRQRFAVPVIAVTGSAGKTTVKEMIGAIMRELGETLVTGGNLNNDIGVPLTLFRFAPAHEAAVIEMGASAPGEIAWLSSIARPDVGVITLCAPAHLEGFGDIETVARAKGEIITGLGADGIAVINADDPFAPLWRELAGSRRVIGFGTRGDVRATRVSRTARGTALTIATVTGTFTTEITFRGRHNVMNALAAVAAAEAAGADHGAIARGLAAARPVGGRLRPRPGIGGARLLDDSYNANPASLEAALDVLAAEPGPRWLVLGDMGELGNTAVAFHRRAGEQAAAAGVEYLFTLGELAREAGTAFAGTHRHFVAHEPLGEAIAAAIEASAQTPTILIKASRSMALDRIANILADEEAASC